MYKWPLRIAGRLLLGLGLSVSFGCMYTSVYAAGTNVNTQLKLQVNAVDCTVDIVQDGSGQTLQIPAHSCLPIVPAILTPILDQEQNETTTPIAIVTPDLPVIIQSQSEPVNGPWSPVATTTLTGQSFRSSSGTFPVMATGVGAVVAATAVGVDAVLFEMSHSKSLARWARARGLRLLLRR